MEGEGRGEKERVKHGWIEEDGCKGWVQVMCIMEDKM